RQYIDTLKTTVIEDPILAAHLIDWQREKIQKGLSQKEHLYVCPVFGNDGRRLTKEHTLPTTLTQLLQGAAGKTKASTYLVGRSLVQKDHTLIEFVLVSNQQSQVIDSLKLKLPTKDWQSPQIDNANRILLEVTQTYKDSNGQLLPSENLTRNEAERLLIPLFDQPPTWVGLDPCLNEKAFDQIQLARHYNVAQLVKVINNTAKGKKIKDNDPDFADLTYATSTIHVSLINANEQFAQTDYECSGTANNYVYDNLKLLRDATQFALANIVENREGCDL
ncbi:MAG: hypothetical protein MJK04_12125, partial [Psychrosphaera sp.]|nr:hypothetical protein [Psychrosphaera sp.]